VRGPILLLVGACAGCGARTPLSTDGEVLLLDGGAITLSCAPAPSARVVHAPRSRPDETAAELDLTGDEQHVYVVDGYPGTDSVGGAIFSIDPCTGDAVPLGTSNFGTSSPVFAFGGNVYSGTVRFFDVGIDISRASPGGGMPSKVATVTAGIAAFAVDTQNVYSVGMFRGVYVTPLDGGAQVEVAVEVNRTIPIVDDAYVYVALPQGIEKLDKQGGVVQLLFPSGTICPTTFNVLRVLASDTASLYVSTNAPSSLWRVPKDGATPVQLTTLNECGPITVDDVYVYFSELPPSGSGGAIVERIPKTGGAKQTVSPASDPGAIYVDSRSVYWLEVDTGILKIDK
jgi:hypothetical protein